MDTAMVPATLDRPPWRRWAAALVFSTAVVLHAFLIVNGGSDPHKRFGFRPFAESDTWRAEIVRVDGDGTRRPVDDGSWSYEWNDLVGAVELSSPWRTRHASGGARTTVDLLDRSLDWLVENTPDDPTTIRYEATVTVTHNGGAPYTIHLAGDERERER